MAGDWIRIRVCLIDDPRVITMTDFLAQDREFMDWLTDPVMRTCDHTAYEHVARNALRCVTVTGLIKVWGVANDIGKVSGDDLLLEHTGIDTLDAIAGVPSFGRAMQAVGWARQDGDLSVTLPNFLTYNDPANSEKRLGNRERQKKYREKQKALRNAPRNALANGDVTRYRREEKRREERGGKQPPAAIKPPGLNPAKDNGAEATEIFGHLDRQPTDEPTPLEAALVRFKGSPANVGGKLRADAERLAGECGDERVIAAIDWAATNRRPIGEAWARVRRETWRAGDEAASGGKGKKPSQYEENLRITREVADRDAEAARQAEQQR